MIQKLGAYARPKKWLKLKRTQKNTTKMKIRIQKGKRQGRRGREQDFELPNDLDI